MIKLAIEKENIRIINNTINTAKFPLKHNLQDSSLFFDLNLFLKI